MVLSQEHQSENEAELDQVQARFPNDTPFFSETLEAVEVSIHSTHVTHETDREKERERVTESVYVRGCTHIHTHMCNC